MHTVWSGEWTAGARANPVPQVDHSTVFSGPVGSERPNPGIAPGAQISTAAVVVLRVPFPIFDREGPGGAM